MAGPYLFDRVKDTTTTTGTGTVTLANSAPTGFRTFGSVLSNSDTVFYCIAAGSEWEVGVGTYSTTGPTLARTTVLASSNSGSAVSFSAGTKDVFCTAPATALSERPAATPGGRLTTESGVGVSTSDRTSQSTLYYTPYTSDYVRLYDGTRVREYLFTERSLSLSGLTSGKNYDVWLRDASGTLTLDLSAAWTNDTTRADALAWQSGLGWVKSGDATRLYLGTIRTTGTTTTEDSAAKRFVWNAYNRVSRYFLRTETTTSWTYGSAAWRQANASAANQVEGVIGISGYSAVHVRVKALYGGTGYGGIGIGADSTSSPSSLCQTSQGDATTALSTNPMAALMYHPTAGYHYWSWLEYWDNGSLTIYGTINKQQGGLHGTIEA